MNREDIISYLNENTDQKYMEFTGWLTPGQGYRMLGVRLPLLRKLARDLAKEHGMAALELLSDETYEEVLLQGMVIGYAKMDLKDKKPYIDAYMPKCDSWSLTDTLATSFKIKEKQLWYQWAREYVSSDQTYTIRFGYIMMLKLLEDEYIDDVIALTIARDSDEYYIEMAQAWLLATAAIKYGDKVEEVLRKQQLNRFTHNRTIQKMVESFRITEQQKETVKGLKR